MKTRQFRGLLLVSCLLATALGAVAAEAATTSQAIQVLDRVAVFGTADVLEMAFDKPDATGPYTPYALQGSNFQACKLTTIDGLYCLDGQAVRHWSDPLKGSATDGAPLFACNGVPNLTACTGLTVDEAGTLWLAGQDKKKTYDLVQVVAATSPPSGPCPTSWQSFPNKTGGPYYACSWATGRPLLVDIMSIDGDAAKTFKYGAGIVGLEQRKTVTFFPADTSKTPFSLGSGKTDWGLSGNEQLEGVAVLPSSNIVMVTTTTGRLLSRDVGHSTLLNAIQIPVQPTPNQGCPGAKSPTYAVRSSFKTGIVYVTDDVSCEVIALDPGTSPLDPTAWQESGRLSTDAYSPVGVTLAAGIGIDMTACDPSTSTDPKGCQFVNGAWLSIPTSTLVTNGGETPSGLTLFQITGIPDCRWADGPGCGPGLIVGPAGHPEAQYLNVLPLLPEEVRKALAANIAANHLNPVTELYISPTYRGQPLSDASGHPVYDGNGNRMRTFDAFFGIPQKGVQFQNTFGLEFNVKALAGTQEGCTLASGLPSGYQPGDLGPLLAWDLATKVSETVISGDAQSFLPKNGGAYVDTLVNTGCGSSKGTSFGWSLVPYNLEVTPDTYFSGTYCSDDPSVFAHLLGKLYDDFTVTTQVYACSPADGTQPIDSATCSTLLAQIDNGRDKLQKCLDAAYQPKTSAGNQNCQSFVSQLNNVEATIDATLNSGSASNDPNNRRGEAKTRLLVISHVLTDKFLPSVPDGGFQPVSASCPAPVKLLGSP